MKTKSPWWKPADVVHQRPGMVHYLFDYSSDMEYLEIVSPRRFRFGIRTGRHRQSASRYAMEIIHSMAGMTVFGAALSLLMVSISRARYGVPSGCRRSWNHTVGGRKV